MDKRVSKLERPSGFTTPTCLDYIRSTTARLRLHVIGAKHRTSYLRAAKRQASTQRTEWSTKDKDPRRLYDNDGFRDPISIICFTVHWVQSPHYIGFRVEPPSHYNYQTSKANWKNECVLTKNTCQAALIQDEISSLESRITQERHLFAKMGSCLCFETTDQ